MMPKKVVTITQKKLTTKWSMDAQKAMANPLPKLDSVMANMMMDQLSKTWTALTSTEAHPLTPTTAMEIVCPQIGETFSPGDGKLVTRTAYDADISCWVNLSLPLGVVLALGEAYCKAHEPTVTITQSATYIYRILADKSMELLTVPLPSGSQASAYLHEIKAHDMKKDMELGVFFPQKGEGPSAYGSVPSELMSGEATIMNIRVWLINKALFVLVPVLCSSVNAYIKQARAAYPHLSNVPDNTFVYVGYTDADAGLRYGIHLELSHRAHMKPGSVSEGVLRNRYLVLRHMLLVQNCLLGGKPHITKSKPATESPVVHETPPPPTPEQFE